MKKVITVVLGLVLTLAFNLSPNTLYAKEKVDFTKKSIVNAVESKIDQRVNLEFEGFNGLESGKIIKMKGANHKFTRALVELDDSNEDLGGYMIVEDTDNGLHVTEFALGDVHPLQDIKSSSVYYLGPLGYYENLGNGKVKDLKTNKKLDFNKLDVNDSSTEQTVTYSNNIDSTSSSNVSDYEYKHMDSVPDYIQADNTSMENDCVPTTAANILMYWDNNGYSGMSTSNDWKNVADRIGVITDHSDSDGVSRSEIAPGFEQYISEKNYSSYFDVTRDTSPSFSDLKSLMDNGDPSSMSVNSYNGGSGGHNITLIGYEQYYSYDTFSWHRSVIVRDNWSSTPESVWFSWGDEDIDDVYKIVE